MSGDPASTLNSLKSKYVLNGNHDSLRYLICHRSHSTRGEFIVFVDPELDIDWECDDKFETHLDTSGLNTQLRTTLNNVAMLEPIAQNWPGDLKLAAKRKLGEAIVSQLEGDTAGANNAITHAQNFFKEKSPQVSRFWTLQACLASGSVALLGLTIAALARESLRSALGRTAFELLCCFLSGCVGATLFVVLRLGKQPKVDSTAERHLHYLEGIARISGGGIAGALIGSLVRIGIILPIFAKAGMEVLAMCAAAMVAGASEKLAAGVITKVENHQTIEKERG